MLLTDVMTPNRHITSPILALVLQHSFVFLGDVYEPAYIALQLGLEIWFEWVVLSDFQYLISNHWTTAFAASTMLLAHWLYVIAAGMNLLLRQACFVSKGHAETEHVKYVEETEHVTDVEETKDVKDVVTDIAETEHVKDDGEDNQDEDNESEVSFWI